MGPSEFPVQRGARVRLSEGLARYLVQLEADGRSDHSIAQARRHGLLLIAALDDPPIDRVRSEEIARVFASPVVQSTADGRLRRASSANAIRSSARSFFGYLADAKLAPTNAARLIRRARVGPVRPRAVSEPDIDALLRALDRARTPAELRDRALILTLLRAGLRIGSAVGLDVEDVDLDAGEARLRRLKNGGEDVVQLMPDLVAVLGPYVGARRTGPLFPGESGKRLTTRQAARRVAQWSDRAGLSKRASPHQFRHAFAMRAYAACGDVLLVAAALTHRSPASTQRYVTPSAARVRAALAG